MNEIITIKEVSKSFKKNLILKNINATINKGDIIGILGQSGSGKSILLNIIAGYLSPTEGTIKKHGKIGFSTQSNSLYEHLSLKQNLNYFSNIYGVENPKEKIKRLIDKLNLKQYFKTPVKKLSGGTKKRADIACALLESPDILILDEPFVGLDSFLVNNLNFFLKNLQKSGTTIILSSHLIHQVDNLCSRVFFINNNSLSEITKPQLKSLYNVKAQ